MFSSLKNKGDVTPHPRENVGTQGERARSYLILIFTKFCKTYSCFHDQIPCKEQKNKTYHKKYIEIIQNNIQKSYSYQQIFPSPVPACHVFHIKISNLPLSSPSLSCFSYKDIKPSPLQSQIVMFFILRYQIFSKEFQGGKKPMTIIQL